MASCNHATRCGTRDPHGHSRPQLVRLGDGLARSREGWRGRCPRRLNVEPPTKWSLSLRDSAASVLITGFEDTDAIKAHSGLGSVRTTWRLETRWWLSVAVITDISTNRFLRALRMPNVCGCKRCGTSTWNEGKRGHGRLFSRPPFPQRSCQQSPRPSQIDRHR
jgi:hypothetical protein